jgi:hypothetical protein
MASAITMIAAQIYWRRHPFDASEGLLNASASTRSGMTIRETCVEPDLGMGIGVGVVEPPRRSAFTSIAIVATTPQSGRQDSLQDQSNGS